MKTVAIASGLHLSGFQLYFSPYLVFFHITQVHCLVEAFAGGQNAVHNHHLVAAAATHDLVVDIAKSQIEASKKLLSFKKECDFDE